MKKLLSLFMLCVLSTTLNADVVVLYPNYSCKNPILKKELASMFKREVGLTINVNDVVVLQEHSDKDGSKLCKGYVDIEGSRNYLSYLVVPSKNMSTLSMSRKDKLLAEKDNAYTIIIDRVFEK